MTITTYGMLNLGQQLHYILSASFHSHPTVLRGAYDYYIFLTDEETET